MLLQSVNSCSNEEVIGYWLAQDHHGCADVCLRCPLNFAQKTPSYGIWHFKKALYQRLHMQVIFFALNAGKEKQTRRSRVNWRRYNSVEEIQPGGFWQKPK